MLVALDEYMNIQGDIFSPEYEHSPDQLDEPEEPKPPPINLDTSIDLALRLQVVELKKEVSELRRIVNGLVGKVSSLGRKRRLERKGMTTPESQDSPSPHMWEKPKNTRGRPRPRNTEGSSRTVPSRAVPKAVTKKSPLRPEPRVHDSMYQAVIPNLREDLSPPTDMTFDPSQASGSSSAEGPTSGSSFIAEVQAETPIGISARRWCQLQSAMEQQKDQRGLVAEGQEVVKTALGRLVDPTTVTFLSQQSADMLGLLKGCGVEILPGAKGTQLSFSLRCVGKPLGSLLPRSVLLLISQHGDYASSRQAQEFLKMSPPVDEDLKGQRQVKTRYLHSPTPSPRGDSGAEVDVASGAR